MINKKEIIKEVLRKASEDKPNLDSETVRENLADKIERALNPFPMPLNDGTKMKPTSYPKYPNQ